MFEHQEKLLGAEPRREWFENKKKDTADDFN
jgi:hypothetical protein